LKATLAHLAILLVDELAASGTAYQLRNDPPTICLVAPGRDPVDLRHDEGELVVTLPGCRLTGNRMPVASIANIITPPIYAGDDITWASADCLEAARKIAGRMFPGDKAATFTAEDAVFQCAAAFIGFGSFEKLAKAFVRNALRNYRRGLASKPKQLPDRFDVPFWLLVDLKPFIGRAYSPLPARAKSRINA
jgi:hypothetical protein